VDSAETSSDGRANLVGMEPDAQDDPGHNLSEAERGRLERIAAVNREYTEMKAANAAIAGGLQLRSARAGRASLVYSIRLARDEVEALERRAAAYGLKPTVLARNLIRMGLAPRGAGDVADKLDEVVAAVEDLRSLVGY